MEKRGGGNRSREKKPHPRAQGEKKGPFVRLHQKNETRGEKKEKGKLLELAWKKSQFRSSKKKGATDMHTKTTSGGKSALEPPPEGTIPTQSPDKVLSSKTKKEGYERKNK